MDDFLTDQQQAARVRGWVREYAPAAIMAVAIGFGGYFGYTQWQAQKERNAAEVSDLYEEFLDILENGSQESAQEALQRMASDFQGSGYVDLGRLLMAKEYVDSTQPSRAEEELKSVIAATANGDLRQLARLRLARVYLYMERPEEGLAALAGEPHSPAWEQLAEDMRGDLHLALGQFEEARAAYQAALNLSGQVDAGWIRSKLDHLNAAGTMASDSGEEAASGNEGAAQGDEAVQGEEAAQGDEAAQSADAAEPQGEAPGSETPAEEGE